MANQILIEIKNTKATSLLKNLEDLNIIRIVTNPLLGLTPKKKRQAKDLLSALSQAKQAEKGEIKLKTAESLLNEL
jgi:hypothetical protein